MSVEEVINMDSVLASIKKLLGIAEEDTDFDTDIVIHINSVLMILNQLGIGPSDGFWIKDNSSVWKDFVGDDKSIEAVNSYVYLKVRLLFDPPLSSAVTDAINKNISELEWRLKVIAENKVSTNSQ